MWPSSSGKSQIGVKRALIKEHWPLQFFSQTMHGDRHRADRKKKTPLILRTALGSCISCIELWTAYDFVVMSTNLITGKFHYHKNWLSWCLIEQKPQYSWISSLNKKQLKASVGITQGFRRSLIVAVKKGDALVWRNFLTVRPCKNDPNTDPCFQTNNQEILHVKFVW